MRRLDSSSRLVPLGLGLLFLLSSACTARVVAPALPSAEGASKGTQAELPADTGEVARPDAGAEEVSPPRARPALRVGRATDGVKVTEVTWKLKGATQVFEFGFSGQGRVPVVEAKLSEDGSRMVMSIYGVREVSSEVPLVSGEGGRVLAAPLAIAEGQVKTIGRHAVLDDSAVRYELELRGDADFCLIEHDTERRLLLEVQPKDAAQPKDATETKK